ncbi:alkaline phosphatase family protein [candidate division KSB1 bacterium]|nr:alkaline phosphatase family protein [candidate division KSB1 bacterium]
MSHQKKVLLIGIDGATYHMLTPLIDAGKLPAFQKLMQTGSYGNLQSPILASSPVGWTSMMTGVNPGRHNIYDYYNGFNGTYQRPFASSSDVRSEQLWRVIGRFGLRSIVMNVPMTFPPDPLRGILISGLPFHNKKRFTFPSYLTSELIQQEYITDFFNICSPSLTEYLATAQKTMMKRQQIFKDLLHKNEWSLGIVNFTTLDRLQSLFWNENEIIQRFYQLMDKLLGELIDAYGEGIQTLVVSPYGYKAVKKKFFVNEWLWEHELLARSVSTEQASIPNFYNDYFAQGNGNGRWITSFLANSHITKDNLRAFIPDAFCELAKKFTPATFRKMFPRENLIIHWERTKAYFPSYLMPGINLNLKGREPQGIVEPGAEYENLRNLIIRELYRLKDPCTFENVIAHVYRKEEIFSGDCLEHAPDIVFVPHRHDYYLDPNKRTIRHCVGYANDDYPVHACRTPHGVVLITGPDVKENYHIPEFNAMDIAPTVLHMLDLPVPEKMDGIIRNDIFQHPTVPVRRSVQYKYQVDNTQEMAIR